MINRPVLEIENLRATYGNNFSLEDINLSINRGDFLAIIGPNGSGKSTLLRCVSGAFKKFLGSILIQSHSVNRTEARTLARLIAVALQNSSRPLHMTVKDYILLGRYPWLGLTGLYGKKDHLYAKDSMKLCGVEAFFNRDTQSLSGGEWQRTVLARTICQLMGSSDSILAPDEITASLDPASALQIFNLLSRLCSQGLTILTCVHDCNLAALFATHMLGLKGGKMLFYGKVRDVFTKHNLELLYDMPVGVYQHPDLDVPQYYPHFTSSCNDWRFAGRGVRGQRE